MDGCHAHCAHQYGTSADGKMPPDTKCIQKIPLLKKPIHLTPLVLPSMFFLRNFFLLDALLEGVPVSLKLVFCLLERQPGRQKDLALLSISPLLMAFQSSGFQLGCIGLEDCWLMCLRTYIQYANGFCRSFFVLIESHQKLICCPVEFNQKRYQ